MAHWAVRPLLPLFLPFFHPSRSWKARGDCMTQYWPVRNKEKLVEGFWRTLIKWTDLVLFVFDFHVPPDFCPSKFTLPLHFYCTNYQCWHYSCFTWSTLLVSFLFWPRSWRTSLGFCTVTIAVPGSPEEGNLWEDRASKLQIRKKLPKFLWIQ